METEDGVTMPEAPQLPQMPHFSAEDMELIMTKFMQFVVIALGIAIAVGFILFLLRHPTTEQWIAAGIVGIFCVVGYWYDRKKSQSVEEDVPFSDMACAA